MALLEELEIPVFEQELGRHAVYEYLSTSPPQLVQLPQNDDPSFRIAGGSSRWIQTLANTLESDQIKLDNEVQAIVRKEQVIEICYMF